MSLCYNGLLSWWRKLFPIYLVDQRNGRYDYTNNNNDDDDTNPALIFHADSLRIQINNNNNNNNNELIHQITTKRIYKKAACGPEASTGLISSELVVHPGNDFRSVWLSRNLNVLQRAEVDKDSECSSMLDNNWSRLKLRS